MKKYILKSILCIGLLLMGSALVATVTASAETLSRILIIPFDIHAEKDQSFLKPAIMDMLYTRLSAENRTVFVEKIAARREPVSAENAISMGLQRNVDYVIIGSITILGTRISTDARFVGVDRKKPLLTFNEVGRNQGDIITHIDHLTTQINESIFGVPKSFETPPAADQGTDDIYIHPEKLLIPGIQPKIPPLPTPSAPAVVIVPQPDKGDVSLSYWKSKIFSVEIQGMSIADVDGDKANETVFIEGKQVHVYQYLGSQLQEIKTFSHGSFNQLIHVDTADINQNGKTEIFLTDYISSQQRLKSVVLEWNGQDFDIITELANWYLRVLQTPASASLLLGQKRGPGSSYTTIKEAVFDRDIHEMKWQDGRYAPAGLFALPTGISLYDFSRGDASNNGQNEIVAFSSNDHISVYHPQGEIAWESSDVYGGNRLFFEVPDLNNARKIARYYLSQRIHVTDIDGDGLNDIIVVKNHDAAPSFSRIKAFSEGHIECLSYDDLGMQLKWQTRKIAGYISDYVIGDLNNDGVNEIVFSAVEKEKGILSKGKSYLVTCQPTAD